jgi:hypothetical protein
VTGSRWWCPDQGFTHLQLDQARAFIAQSPVRDQIVGALATGSPAAGLGHARSELDLFLVDRTDQERAGFESHPRHFQGTTVDLRTLSLADLKQQRQVVRDRDAATAIDRRLFGVGNLLAWSVLSPGW